MSEGAKVDIDEPHEPFSIFLSEGKCIRPSAWTVRKFRSHKLNCLFVIRSKTQDIPNCILPLSLLLQKSIVFWIIISGQTINVKLKFFALSQIPAQINEFLLVERPFPTNYSWSLRAGYCWLSSPWLKNLSGQVTCNTPLPVASSPITYVQSRPYSSICTFGKLPTLLSYGCQKAMMRGHLCLSNRSLTSKLNSNKYSLLKTRNWLGIETLPPARVYWLCFPVSTKAK